VLDDAPFFLYSIQLTGRIMMPPSFVFEHWAAEFEGLHSETGKCFVLAMHPQIIGRPSRIELLERLIAHIRQHDDVWLARCDEVADSLSGKL
jgi:peptidoglycan/xylan/chitin deacetylase (PgdA/CDA1 family)